ncbi:MAG: lipocalin-like domain-containing protein [Gemmatimonadales bacterium]
MLAQDAVRLVGTWRLVSFVNVDSTGTERPYWDEHAIGVISYSADGRVAVQLYDARRSGLRTNWPTVNRDTARTAFVGVATYYGMFTVDTVSHTVTHHIQGAMAPDWVGTDLVRTYRFLPSDRLELRVADRRTRIVAASGAKLVWERIAR